MVISIAYRLGVFGSLYFENDEEEFQDRFLPIWLQIINLQKKS